MGTWNDLFTEDDIDRLIDDVVPAGDMTTTLLERSGKKGSISLVARNEMIACCTEEAVRLYKKRWTRGMVFWRFGVSKIAGTAKPTPMGSWGIYLVERALRDTSTFERSGVRTIKFHGKLFSRQSNNDDRFSDMLKYWYNTKLYSQRRA